MNKVHLCEMTHDNGIVFPCVYVSSIKYKTPVDIQEHDIEINNILNCVNSAIETSQTGFYTIIIDNDMVKMSDFDKDFFTRVVNEIKLNDHLSSKLIECRVINTSNAVKTLIDIINIVLPRKIKKLIKIV